MRHNITEHLITNATLANIQFIKWVFTVHICRILDKTQVFPRLISSYKNMLEGEKKKDKLNYVCFAFHWAELIKQERQCIHNFFRPLQPKILLNSHE